MCVWLSAGCVCVCVCECVCVWCVCVCVCSKAFRIDDLSTVECTCLIESVSYTGPGSMQSSKCQAHMTFNPTQVMNLLI